MGNLFNKILLLCDEKGVTPSRMCLDIGLSKSLITEIKSGRTKQLSASTATKISDHFDIPTDFLLDRPPFDCWELINQNRKGFLYYTGLDSAKLRSLWGIDDQNPDETPVRDFITFLSQAVESARPTEEGDWEITLKPAYQKNEKTPTAEDGSEEQQLDYSFFRVMKNAKEKGFSPEDIELALDFLKRARGRDQQ